MGLLDDAIREHLELKRRRGADPDEVARQENEALGETRRAEFARPEGAEGPEPPVTESDEGPETAESAPAPEPPRADSAEAEPAGPPEFVTPEPEPPAPRPEPTEEPVSEAASPVEAGDEREPFDIEADEPGPPARAESWVEDEPDEVPAEEALDHPRTDEGEDVLEETPDFLQETPEHDRLWFEQRPPRDFDWDK